MPDPMNYSNSMFPSDEAFEGWFHAKLAFLDLPVRVVVDDCSRAFRSDVVIQGKIDGHQFYMRFGVPHCRPRDAVYLAAQARHRWDRCTLEAESYVPYDRAVIESWACDRPVTLEVNPVWGNKKRMRFAENTTLVVSPAVQAELYRDYDVRLGVDYWSERPAGSRDQRHVIYFRRWLY